MFGASGGTCAEYAVAPETRLAAKPANLTFEQAAAVPTSALAALHGLRDAAGLQRGQTVLINGAAGGVGTFAVQIAKAMGAHVTGVCSTANVDLVESLGADAVIDYTRDDFTRGHAFDVVFDNVENRSLSEDRRALTEGNTRPQQRLGGQGWPPAADTRPIAVAARLVALCRAQPAAIPLRRPMPLTSPSSRSCSNGERSGR